MSLWLVRGEWGLLGLECKCFIKQSLAVWLCEFVSAEVRTPWGAKPKMTNPTANMSGQFSRILRAGWGQRWHNLCRTNTKGSWYTVSIGFRQVLLWMSNDRFYQYSCTAWTKKPQKQTHPCESILSPHRKFCNDFDGTPSPSISGQIQGFGRSSYWWGWGRLIQTSVSCLGGTKTTGKHKLFLFLVFFGMLCLVSVGRNYGHFCKCLSSLFCIYPQVSQTPCCSCTLIPGLHWLFPTNRNNSIFMIPQPHLYSTSLPQQ